MREHYVVGLDLGQRQDYTALAVVERGERELELDRVSWAHRTEVTERLRHLERVPLGTPYPEVVRQVRELVMEERVGRPCALVADATGVGGPVMDLLRSAEMDCEVVPVTITAGDRAARAEGMWRVPKRDLVVGLQVALESGRLRIAAGMREAPRFLKEMIGMRVKASAAGHEGYGAWREGEHDDLVLAVALACWRAGWREVGWQTKPLGFEYGRPPMWTAI